MRLKRAMRGMSARTLRLIQRVNVELLMRVRLWATMWSRYDDSLIDDFSQQRVLYVR